MTYCFCGCGQEVKNGNKFIHGHNGRLIIEDVNKRIKLGLLPSGFSGRTHSEESNRKISQAKKGSVSWNKGLAKETDERVKEGWCKGLTKETDSRIAEAAIKSSLSHIGLPRNYTQSHSEETKELLRQINLSFYSDPKNREKRSRETKEKWKDPAYVSKQMKGRGVRPNKLEERFVCLLAEENLIQFRYVGDGELIIGGKCPDFWNGDHKLIEVYGDYWHRGEDPKDRIYHFVKYGYNCLIIWEHELKNPEQITLKVADFTGQYCTATATI